MEEQKSTAGQGLGIASLIMGILAIPMGIIPCTFIIGILFGIVGLILGFVALSQANRGFGAKNIIIAAIICSGVGLTSSLIWGFTLANHGVGRMIQEIVQDGIPPGGFEDFENDGRDVLEDLENDTVEVPSPSSDDMNNMTDTLKALEGEDAQP